MTEPVRINPKGARAHDHTRRARIIATRHQMETLLGTPHSEGDGVKTTAEWFLVTKHGTATVFNYWAYGDDDYSISTSSDESALLIVKFLQANQLQAYMLTGEMA